jgi:hypothetical protein
MAMLRQVTVLAPGSTLAMTFLLPLQFADPEVGLSWQRKGREPAVPSATSRAEPMAFDRRTMRKNCSSRRRGGDDIPPGPSGLEILTG